MSHITTAPILSKLNYFRQKYFAFVLFAVSLSKDQLNPLCCSSQIYVKQLHLKQNANKLRVKWWGRVECSIGMGCGMASLKMQNRQVLNKC